MEAALIDYFAELKPWKHNGSKEFWIDPRYREFICLPVSEAEILREFVREHQPARILEIGCYVGLSTAYLAVDAPNAIDVVDNFAVNPDIENVFWINMERCGLTDKVRLTRSSSPDCLDAVAGGRQWDFVFVDGYHEAGQPLRDVLGALPHLAASGTVALHDTNCPDVREAGNYLLAHGFRETLFPTPGFLAFYTRS